MCHQSCQYELLLKQLKVIEELIWYLKLNKLESRFDILV